VSLDFPFSKERKGYMSEILVYRNNIKGNVMTVEANYAQNQSSDSRKSSDTRGTDRK